MKLETNTRVRELVENMLHCRREFNRLSEMRTHLDGLERSCHKQSESIREELGDILPQGTFMITIEGETYCVLRSEYKGVTLWGPILPLDPVDIKFDPLP